MAGPNVVNAPGARSAAETALARTLEASSANGAIDAVEFTALKLAFTAFQATGGDLTGAANRELNRVAETSPELADALASGSFDSWQKSIARESESRLHLLGFEVQRDGTLSEGELRTLALVAKRWFGRRETGVRHKYDELSTAAMLVGFTRVLQSGLAEAGFLDPCHIDGRATEETKQALRAYQRAHGLAETGRLDAATRQALGFGHDIHGETR